MTAAHIRSSRRSVAGDDRPDPRGPPPTADGRADDSPTRPSTRPASTSSRARSTSTPTWSCRSAAPSPRTRSRPARAPRRSAGRRRSSTSRSRPAGAEPARRARCLAREGRGQRRRRLRLPHDHERRQRRHAQGDGHLVAEGVPDFKLFTAYPGVFYSDDGAIFRAMQQTAKNGGLIMMHAENGMAIDVVAAQTVGGGTIDPIGHGLARKADLRGRGDQPRHPPGRGCRRPGLHRPSVGPGGPRRGARGARSRHQRLRRDLPAVPLPLARRPRAWVRGRQVRVLAAAAARRITGRTCGSASSRTTCSSSRPTTAPSTSTGRRSWARTTSARSPTACPVSRTGST